MYEVEQNKKKRESKCNVIKLRPSIGLDTQNDIASY